jgi:hypothetical protein
MWTYKILGSIGAVVYIAIFTAGIVVDSSPYRAQVTGGAFSFTAFIAAMLTYTPTNIAFLALLAGYVAGCASRITSSPVEVPSTTPTEPAAKAVTLSTLYRSESPIASMFRSLIVYFGFLAGILVTTVDQFSAPTPDQYIRLAAAVSFFSFVIGYDPTRLSSLLSNVTLPLKSGQQ